MDDEFLAIPRAAPRVLVIAADRASASELERDVTAGGFRVAAVTSAREGLSVTAAFEPDLITLDVALPDATGAELCRALRGDPATRATPLVVVSARNDEIDRVVLFELGIDDYVTVPYSARELVLRLRAHLRRAQPRAAAAASAPAPRAGRVAFGVLAVDTVAHRVFVDGREVTLTPLEFRLLAALFSRAGRVQPRDALLASVWQRREVQGARTVDTHVKRLRRKLGRAGWYIQTVRGLGYRFVENPHDTHGAASPTE